jgi:hypothetical protein
MSDRIETIAELKKAIEKHLDFSDMIFKRDALHLISEFEASVKERLNKIETLEIYWSRSVITRSLIEKELRRLLGEGAGHDAGTG